MKAHQTTATDYIEMGIPGEKGFRSRMGMGVDEFRQPNHTHPRWGEWISAMKAHVRGLEFSPKTGFSEDGLWELHTNGHSRQYQSAKEYVFFRGTEKDAEALSKKLGF